MDTVVFLVDGRIIVGVVTERNDSYASVKECAGYDDRGFVVRDDRSWEVPVEDLIPIDMEARA